MDTNTTKFIISKSENNNKDMISTIDLGECKNEVLSSNSLEMNNSLYILHIQATEEGISFPIIVYEVYYKLESNTSFKNLNLENCKGIKINKTIIANISEDNIDKYNSSSGYYNDICYPSSSETGTDIILSDRRIEYVQKYAV